MSIAVSRYGHARLWRPTGCPALRTSSWPAANVSNAGDGPSPRHKTHDQPGKRFIDSALVARLPRLQDGCTHRPQASHDEPVLHHRRRHRPVACRGLRRPAQGREAAPRPGRRGAIAACYFDPQDTPPAKPLPERSPAAPASQVSPDDVEASPGSAVSKGPRWLVLATFSAAIAMSVSATSDHCLPCSGGIRRRAS